ncbi:MAG: hypothetical protein NZ870_03835, partial [bacterium]|nr:hypothetical protein [bacterium]
QFPTYTSPAASYFNPVISVLPNIKIGETTIENGDKKVEKFYKLDEIEITFQSPVDPFSRADIFITAKEDHFGIEEAYLTLLKLPYNLQAKFGKIRPPIGRWNLIHFSEHFTASHPEIFDELFKQDEGIAITGFEASYLFPLPVYTLFTYNGGLANVSGSTVSSSYNLRFSIGEKSNFDIGVSYLVDNPSQKINTLGYHILFRNRPPGRELYKYTHIQWEHYFMKEDQIDKEGFIAFFNQQFYRTFHFGVMLDGIRKKEDDHMHTELNHAFNITYFPSEFSRYRLEYRWTKHHGVSVIFEVVFSIGPHRPHIY